MDRIWYTSLVSSAGNSFQFNVTFGAKGGMRRLYYRLDPGSEFVDAGETIFRHPETGELLPNLTIQVPFSAWKDSGGKKGILPIEVKYLDAHGSVQGPFEVSFDGTKEIVTFVKAMLRALPEWAAVMRSPSSHSSSDPYLAYFSSLLAYRFAIQKIEYRFDRGAFRELRVSATDDDKTGRRRWTRG